MRNTPAFKAKLAKAIPDLQPVRETIPLYMRPSPVDVLTCSFIEISHGARCQVRLGQRTLLSFIMSPYPACCSMAQFYDFNYNFLTKEQVHALLKVCIPQTGIQLDMYWANKRLMVAMVEATRVQKYESRALVKKVFVEDPLSTFVYPHIHSFFKKQKKCATSSIHYNYNTGNLIHLLEVIL